ncbi:MAG: OmpA family protein [Gammaproteobacteria bacterium]|nr:OmpA family protein [Gammaproteobacteria bacterium]
MKAKRNVLLTSALSTSLLLNACTTVNPYTNERQTSKAVIGAGTAALAGAVIGLISGDNSRERRKRALIGAGLGAIAGGTVGYYMDVQEAKLRQQLQGTGVSVTRQGNNIILNMPSNITFGVDSSAIDGAFFDVLNSVNIVVKEYNKTLIEVMGHTDSSGSSSHNLALSERRAQAVASYFRSRGVDPLRLETYGYGEDYPVASNASADGRSKNRRVELVLVPIT